ncbi:Predicted ATPase [Nocardiopsis flavescens]|uniref:Predicted ATPase n=1 Tax=Nocardiopsis flavescens TaxID=758803 RepID=A0A1M6MTF0_9ACTN|nr:AAA family ATPase [Nocardiopsis flavescens]SHJ86761.1 Predicted ATPase [Nocardiopsis flavescens]
MERRRLSSLTIEGLTSIRSATVELGDVNVLVGANGSGKSNFISALEMVGRIADGRMGLHALQSGGASNLLYKGPEPSGEVALKLVFEEVTYEATLTPTKDDALIFNGEKIAARAEGSASSTNVEVTGGSKESILFDVGTGNTTASPAMREISEAVLDQLTGCRVFHFNDTGPQAPVKGNGSTADNLALHPDAANLAAVLMRLRDDEPGVYGRILRDIRGIAPFLRDFVLVEQNERVRLRWTQQDSENVFPASAMSDGTLRFVCLATLLNMPGRPGIIVLDEPELGLHPYAIVQLGEMVRAAAVDSQIVIATQSVTLIDQVALEDLVVVEREAGASTFRRPVAEELRMWLEEYSLGELWQKNLLGGRPRSERR